MSNAFHDNLAERIRRLSQGRVELRVKRDEDGRLAVPRSVTLQITFSVPELRAFGVNVLVLDVNGSELTDAEYAELLIVSEQTVPHHG